MKGGRPSPDYIGNIQRNPETSKSQGHFFQIIFHHSIVLLGRNHTPNSTPRVFYITPIPRYDMNMTMEDGLTTLLVDVKTDIVSIRRILTIQIPLYIEKDIIE